MNYLQQYITKTHGFTYILTCNSQTLNVTRFVSKLGNFINNIRTEYHLRIDSIKLRHIKHKIYIKCCEKM